MDVAKKTKKKIKLGEEGYELSDTEYNYFLLLLLLAFFCDSLEI